MQIKKVDSRYNFKHTYLSVGGSVVTLEHALNTYPNLTQQIYNAAENDSVRILPPYKYPTYEEMERQIELEIKKMFNNLNIQKTKDEHKTFLNIAKIYNYLSSNYTFDMRTMEERSTSDYNKLMSGFRKDLIAEKSEKKKTQTKRTMGNIKAAFIKDDRLKGAYNLIVRKRGVCFDATISINYILKSLGKKSCALILKMPDKKDKHVVALIPFVARNNNNNYFIADLNIGQNKNKNVQTKNRLIGFGLSIAGHRKYYKNLLPDHIEDLDFIVDENYYNNIDEVNNKKRDFFYKVKENIIKEDIDIDYINELANSLEETLDK